MPELEAGFYQQQLFEQGFACVVRKDHPRIDKRITAPLFKRERHVVITAPGTGHELLERELHRIGVLPTLPGLPAGPDGLGCHRAAAGGADADADRFREGAASAS
jgi:DNA-binding transcriptional LysR family regulator